MQMQIPITDQIKIFAFKSGVIKLAISTPGSILKLYLFNGGGNHGFTFGSVLALPTGFFKALNKKIADILIMSEFTIPKAQSPRKPLILT